MALSDALDELVADLGCYELDEDTKEVLDRVIGIVSEYVGWGPRPCPVCHEDPKISAYSGWESNRAMRYAIECQCGERTDWMESCDEAIEEWNGGARR